MKLTRCYDLALIAQLDRDIFAADIPLTKRELEGGDWWVAWDGKTPVGYCGSSTFQPEGEDIKVLWLERAGVLKSHRGHRLQRRMIAARCRQGRKLGCKQARTYTAAHNIGSMRSLCAVGFRPYAHDQDDSAGELLYWAKYL